MAISGDFRWPPVGRFPWPPSGSNVEALHRHRNASPGLASEHLQHGIAWLTVDLDACRRLERLCVRARSSLRDQLHMKLHRGGIRMYLDHANLAALLVRVLVERQQLRLVRLDERAEIRRAVPLCLEPTLLQSVCRDEDEWPR